MLISGPGRSTFTFWLVLASLGKIWPRIQTGAIASLLTMVVVVVMKDMHSLVFYVMYPVLSTAWSNLLVQPCMIDNKMPSSLIR